MPEAVVRRLISGHAVPDVEIDAALKVLFPVDETARAVSAIIELAELRVL